MSENVISEKKIVENILECMKKLLELKNDEKINLGNFQTRAENAPVLFKMMGPEGFLLYYAKEDANFVKLIIQYLKGDTTKEEFKTKYLKYLNEINKNKSKKIDTIDFKKAYHLYFAVLSYILSKLKQIKLPENNCSYEEYTIKLLQSYIDKLKESDYNKYLFETVMFNVMKYLKLISKGIFKDEKER